MRQITRCPFCETCFKVSHAQLSLSDGWVRCGKCTEVFDATQHLQHAQTATPSAPLSQTPETSAPPAAPADGARANTAAAASDDGPSRVGSSSVDRQAFDNFLRITDGWHQSSPSDAAPTMPAALAIAPAEHEHEWPAQQALSASPQTDPSGIDPAYLDELFEASKSAHAQSPALTPASQTLERPDPKTEDELATPLQDEGPEAALAHPATLDTEIDPAALQFVRHANKRMFWRKKSTRTILAVLALVFLILLAAQLAVWQRQTLSAINPTSKAWMQALCIPMGCTITPRADLEALSIDSSSFQIISPQNYALSWTLLNSSRLWTKTPSLEVVLLDKNENAVIQQVFTPQALGQAPEIAPQTREPITQGLQIARDQPEITGYRLRIFYPQ